jgi:hypothetical protein
MAFNPQDTFPQMRSDSVSIFPFNVFICPYFTPNASAYSKDLSIELHIFMTVVSAGFRESFYGVLPIVASCIEGESLSDSDPTKDIAYTIADTVWSHLEYSDFADWGAFSFTLVDRPGGNGFDVQLDYTGVALTYDINSYAIYNKEQEDA